MNYRAPEFTEIKMDAEIGSYQEADQPERDPIASRERLPENAQAESARPE